MNRARPCRTIGWSSIRNTLHFGSHSLRLSSITERKQAYYRGTASEILPHIERTTNHVRAVTHDIQTHASVTRRCLRYSSAVILNSQCSFSILGGQTNNHMAWMPMLDRVIHCLTRDVVEMGRNAYVVNKNRTAAFEPASNLEQILHLLCVTSQRGHQTMS